MIAGTAKIVIMIRIIGTIIPKGNSGAEGSGVGEGDCVGAEVGVVVDFGVGVGDGDEVGVGEGLVEEEGVGVGLGEEVGVGEGLFASTIIVALLQVTVTLDVGLLKFGIKHPPAMSIVLLPVSVMRKVKVANTPEVSVNVSSP